MLRFRRNLFPTEDNSRTGLSGEPLAQTINQHDQEGGEGGVAAGRRVGVKQDSWSAH